jgi:hypothetical protein
MTTAESNVAELLAFDPPGANVVVSGKLVQGRMTAHMARVLEWKARFESLPESATEAEWDTLSTEMRADLETIEPSSMGRIANADDTAAAVESMSPEELLRESEGLAPPEGRAS